MKKELGFKDIVVVFLIILLLIIIGFFFVYSNKKENTDNNGINKEIVGIATYKTSDNRFTLIIVEKNNDDAISNARIRYGERNFDEIIKQSVKLYAYLNNRVFAIDDVKEDNNYALYSFIGLPTEEYGHKVLVNKIDKTIEVSETDLNKVTNSCLSNGFCGFQSQPGYIKSSIGYYFTNNDHGLVTIYTNKWKKIGYIDKTQNIRLDSDGGIYVYEQVEKKNCNGNYCEYEGINDLIKYDINGNKQ